MSLKTLVKVGNISNLSDARYCSGMGVDMLGFAVAEGHQAYIEPTLYREIRGWIAGPSAVAELYGLKPDHSVESVIENYMPDYLELSPRELPLVADNDLPLIVALTPQDDPAPVFALAHKIAYIQLKEADRDLIRTIPPPLSVLLELQSATGVENLLANDRVKGLALNGSPEVRPGYKEYGDLADVLEQLEVD